VELDAYKVCVGFCDAVQRLGDDVLRLVDQLLHIASAQVESLRQRVDWPLFRHPAFYLDIWGLRFTSRDQALINEDVVDDRADDPPNYWSDDREPPVPVDVAVIPRQGHPVPACEPGEEPRAEVAGRIDGVTAVGAVGHPDPGHQQADDPWPKVSFRSQVAIVDDR